MKPTFIKLLQSTTVLFFFFQITASAQFRITNGGTDYAVYAFYDQRGPCQCNEDYIFSFYRRNYLPSNFLGSKTSSSKKGNLSYAVGPNKSDTYNLNLLVQGKNKWLVFDCSSDCEKNYGKTYYNVKTEKIKKPHRLTASKNQDYIEVGFTALTNIPDKYIKYEIHRDSENNLIGTVNGSSKGSGRTYRFVDTNVGPGEEHTYYVKTTTTSWGGHKSTAASITGNTAERTLATTLEQPKKVTLTWDDLSGFTDKVTVRRNGEQIGNVEINSAGDSVFTDSDPSLIPGYAYMYSLTWIKNEVEYSISELGSTQANGRIRGSVKTPIGQNPIEGVEVCAEQMQDIDQSKAGIIYCDTTDENGQYDIRKIYYHTEARFKVTPKKEGHAFDPSFYNSQLLELDFPSLNLDFIDTTSYEVGGYVTQLFQGEGCGIEGIEIWVNDVYTNVLTDQNGFFLFEVEESGTYKIEPKLSGHEFLPASKTLFINAPTEDVNFEDTRTNFVDGYVKGSCDIEIGTAMVRAYSLGEESCIDTLIPTNEQGYYKAVLPARKYELEVVEFNEKEGLNLTPQLVLDYFETEEIDITFEGQTKDFVFRREPEIRINGLPFNSCSDLATAIVEQGERYQLEIEVIESFGDASCPVDTGYLLIYDEVSDKDGEADTLYLEFGKATYALEPGVPNLVAPHQKLLQVEAFVGKEVSQWVEPLLVTGIRPREQTFTTVLPEIPMMILHDPPGDASYSYFEKAFKASLGMRLFGSKSGSLTAKKEIKLGTRFESGSDLFSLKFEKWGTIGGALSVGSSVSGSTEWNVSFETNERFATSNNENITGEEGDVYVGAAMNLIYAQSDVLTVDANNCSVDKTVDMVMGNDGFATTFMYTEDHVENILIPQLRGIRDFYRTTNSDSAAIYETQINVWKQVVEENAKNKRNAKFKENRSFSAGATYASSTTSSAELSTSIEFSAFLEESVVIGSGFDVAGSGAKGSVETKLRMEIGSSITGAALSSTTTGFELKDDDPGDFFSVNIKSDPVYGTPVFELVSGRSSCPWEPGTQPRESLQLLSDAYSIRNVPEDDQAVFQLSLGNISQSDEPRTYILKFLQASNPDGAVVSIGGSQAQDPIPYTIGAGNQSLATVTINKGPRANQYNGLKFVLTSGCGDAIIADTVSLNASFKNNYPDLVLAEPGENWLINQENNDAMLLRMKDYDKERLKKIQLQFTPVNQSNWNTIAEWQPSILSDDDDGTVVGWNVANMLDGNFMIRLRADYGDEDVYSESMTGVIDRKMPQLYGLPEPGDGEWIKGDLISLSVDEPLNCFAIQSTNITFKSLTTGDSYPVNVGCNGNEIIIEPLWNADDHVGEDIEVTLVDFADLNYNINTEPIIWAFTIGGETGATNLDFDNDGIFDDVDNCRLTVNSNQQDLDEDGIGDACDEDIDGDDIVNLLDNCPYTYNPDQLDSDNDGEGDVCEADADGDEDGVTNSLDNCPYTYNPDQEDEDLDGIGDVCDEDLDGDGIVNRNDNCPNVPNPMQLDSNSDLVGDACAQLVNTDEIDLGVELIDLYPNPAAYQVHLSLSVLEKQHWNLHMMNSNGQVILAQNLGLLTEGTYLNRIDIGNLPNGMYIVQLISNRGVVSRKLIVNQ